MKRNPLYANYTKRGLDIVISIILLLLLWPIMLITAVLIRLSLGTPVLFRQERTGAQGRIFEMLKFRSMRDAKDSSGAPLPDEMRLGRLGDFLRKCSLDELPELVHVLNGDMSLIGPRPLLPKYLPRYTQEQARRHEVKPGITGWAQVNGRNTVDWDQRFQYDVWYVDHLCFALDLKILLLTAWKVFHVSETHAEGHVSSPEFKGKEDDE